jgi:hypothetical protein
MYLNYQTKKNEMGETCNRHRGYETKTKIFFGKPDGKRSLCNNCLSLGDRIKFDLKTMD